jgi:large conductance mechanosensitive channel
LNGQPYGLPLVEAKKAGAVLAYGNFLTILLNFLILAFVIFQMVRLMNRMSDGFHRRKEDDALVPAAPPEDIVLLREIRDALKSR